MPNQSDRILEAREKRQQTVSDLLQRYPTVVSIKSNVPGKTKLHPLACFLVKRFARLLAFLTGSSREVADADGYYHLYGLNDDASAIKQKTVLVEESEPLGRFIDIDVYDKNGPLSRIRGRKCYICDDLAANCIRSGRHLASEVMNAFTRAVEAGLKTLILQLIKASIRDELDLDPKFGLVTPTSSGTHADMDYELMLASAEAIYDDLYHIFALGFHAESAAGLMPRLRIVGLEAEAKMLARTNGINTYKGLIFSLGITLAASGFLLGKPRTQTDVFAVAAAIAAGLSAELGKKQETFGEIAYQRYGFTGARGEAEAGFPGVQGSLGYLKDLSDESRWNALAYLIGTTDDTVLLKRSGTLENYRKHQSLFEKIGPMGAGEAQRLTEYALEHNLSFGGSADLLVVACFLKRWRDAFGQN